MFHRMDLCEKGDVSALVEDTLATNRAQQTSGQNNDKPDHVTKVYAGMLLQGKLRQVVRWATNREQGGPLLPTDTDSKSGRPVGEVLEEKHPPPETP